MSTWSVYNFNGDVALYQEVTAYRVFRDGDWVIFADEDYNELDMFFRPIRVRKIS